MGLGNCLLTEVNWTMASSMRKCLVITLNGQSMFSEVIHWTFDDVWKHLEIMDDEEANLRCLFRKEV